MPETKEAILLTALHLFAAEGYEAVSVSQIAGALGMTKGALYKHYQNKRDIFAHILLRMEQMDALQAENYALPEGTAAEMAEKYHSVSIEQFVAYSRSQFRYWTEDDFASSFRKMLTLEQFRSEEMQKLYQQYLAAEPVGYVADLFTALELPAPQEHAAVFYAILFLFYSLYDGAVDQQKITAQFEKALEHFVENELVPIQKETTQ